MITIDFLKNHPQSIPTLAKIWHEVLGKIWIPDLPISRVEENLYNHLNETQLPITFVAFDSAQPVGMGSLRVNNGISQKIGL